MRGLSKSVQFGPWLPDQLPVGVVTTAENVLPFAMGERGETGYGPVGAFSAVSSALSGSFLGGASFISTGGDAYLLAGTSNGLYRLSGGAWTTLVNALAITGRWRFVQFANYAICVNEAATREVDLSTATQAVIAAAPTGNFVGVVGADGGNGGHVVITRPGGARLDVAWSDENDRNNWTTGASGQETMASGGEVMGVASGEYGVILQRSRLVRMEPTGDSAQPFAFNAITDNYGCAAAASIVQAGRTVFFLSDRGFMALEDGQAIKPIGNEKFDQHFRDVVPRADWERIYTAVDPRRTLVMWGSPGSPGKVWVYNWALDRAVTFSLPFEGLFAGYDVGVSLDALDALYGDLDAVPYSLDDARFQGGAPGLYVVASGTVGLLAGTNLAATVAQGFIQPAQGRARVRGVWPEINATSGVTARIEGYQRMGDTPDSASNGTMQASGRIPLRVSGHNLRIAFDIAAGTSWSLFTGYRLEAEGAGVRT